MEIFLYHLYIHVMRWWVHSESPEGNNKCEHNTHTIYWLFCRVLYVKVSVTSSESFLVIRPHGSTIEMQAIVTNWVVQSVCRSVCHSTESCKNGWTDRDAIWDVNSGGPKEACIRWCPDSAMGMGNFEGERAAHCKVYGMPSICSGDMASLSNHFDLLFVGYCRNN